MGEYQPGDLVDITIRGARITKVRDEAIEVDYGEHWSAAVSVLADAVSIERAQPANWPPMVGDLWAGGRDGEPIRLVGIHGTVPIGEPAAALISDGGCEYDIDEAAGLFGPLRLLYRDGRGT